MKNFILTISFLLAYISIYGQQVNVSYLNPTHSDSAKVVYEFLRLGTSSNYWGGLMHNISSTSYGNGEDFSIFTYGNRDMTFRTGTGNFIIFPSDGGKVGIGTSNPQSKLHISTTNSNAFIYSQTGGVNGSLMKIGAVSSNGMKEAQIQYEGRFGLYNVGTSSFSMTIDEEGYVGIGYKYPKAGLHVAKYSTLEDGTKLAAVLGNDWNSWTTFGSVDGGRIRGSGEGYLVLESNPNGIDRRVLINSKSSGDVLIAHGGGNVIVGSLDGVDISKLNSGFNLFVRKGIMAEKVKVALKSGWSDFVFDENYALPTLSEVESFIQENNHLQDIPSAKEVEEHGINLGEMDAKLLQKIEELMLYTIEQEKKIEKQVAKIQKLEDENLELKKQQEKINKQEEKIETLEKLVNQLLEKE
ncbi:hypothetical protein R9C00_19590 [Flammeovirgaceae bacterium SG7u.111]|nr:hypothetical protein [Flammeovirgaceae bacterium SG7u.132]WPO33905.1 hypothetical protein R9C00_19590 [Flammeovirgaceae bacterium SG7u.111]